MRLPCPVCRALPADLRKRLLGVAAGGDPGHPLWPVAVAYVAWGVTRAARGEDPWPTAAHRPPKADDAEVFGAWVTAAMPRRRRNPGPRLPKLKVTPKLRRTLAARFDVTEDTAAAAVDRALARLGEFGPRVTLDDLVRAGIVPDDPVTVTELPSGAILAITEPPPKKGG